MAVLVSAGCYTYRPVIADQVSLPAEVRIEFTPPETLVFYSASRDSTVVENVSMLKGRLVGRDSASVTLDATDAEVVGEAVPRRFAYRTTVRAATSFMEERQVNQGRTALLVLSLVGFLSVILVAVTGDSYEPPPQQKDSSSKSY
jgi:type IV secretory pathway protease TraF